MEELVARLRPQPLVPSTIRRLPNARQAPAPTPLPEAASGSPSDAGGFRPTGAPPGLESGTLILGTPVPPPPGPSLTRRAVVEPLAPQQYRVQFTASTETYEKLRLAQDLLRHRIPDGDLGQIIDLALTVSLVDLAMQMFAAANRPRDCAAERQEGNRGAMPHSRHLPPEVKRTVWIRDGGRCAFVARTGRRCTERTFLEFHHIVPYGAGGEATADNIQLRCRAHNAYESELYFGRRMSMTSPRSGPSRGSAQFPTHVLPDSS